MKTKMKTYKSPKRRTDPVLREAYDELYEKHLRGEFDEGDPNHPKYNAGYNYATGKFILFGYEQDEFLAKQYKGGGNPGGES